MCTHKDSYFEKASGSGSEASLKCVWVSIVLQAQPTTFAEVVWLARLGCLYVFSVQNDEVPLELPPSSRTHPPPTTLQILAMPLHVRLTGLQI